MGNNLVSSGGRSSAGRAFEWHSKGQGFDPPRLQIPPTHSFGKPMDRSNRSSELQAIPDESSRLPRLIFLSDWFIEAPEEWSLQLPYFQEFFRCFTISLEGHNAPISSPPHTSLLEATYMRLEELVVSEKSSVRIVAHGVATVIALRLAMRQPGRVRSMVLIAPRFDFSGESWFRIASTFSAAGVALYLMIKDPLGERLRKRETFRKRRRVLPLRLAARYMKELRSLDLNDDLDRITVRSSIIIGDADPITAPQHAIDLNERLPSSHLIRYQALGHNPHRESAPMINQVIHDFLKKSDTFLGRKLEQIRGFFQYLFRK